jgi:hypothetical protein
MNINKQLVVRRPLYIAIQIPEEGDLWVEAGHFHNHHEAFDNFERNDSNTIVFSIADLVKIFRKTLIAISSLESN